MNEVLILDNMVDPASERKIFLGKYSGFQRFDIYKYPFAKQIEEKMRNAFWNPNEISLVNDRVRFEEDLPEHAKEILTLNLLFQTLMDSAQSRGLEMVLCDITTSPEWEGVFKTQAYFEQIHSLSYSHIIREVFPNATEVFDRIGKIPEIRARLKKEIELYNYFKTEEYEKLPEEEKKKRIIELVARIYFLEALKFYVSFLVTYVINTSYNNAIQKITKIIKLINFDEDMHVSVMSGLLSILKKNEDEGFSDLLKSQWFVDMMKQIAKEVVEDEINWGKFLLSHGDVPSLTVPVIETFAKWWGNERLARMKIEPIYKVDKIDIIDWFNMYRDIDLDNTAQQEAEGLAYKIGILQNDIPDGKIIIKP